MAEAVPVGSNGTANGSAAFDDSELELSSEEMVQKLERDMQVREQALG